MTRKTSLKPIAAAIGTSFIVSLAAVSSANAAENPFNATELSNGYMLAEKHGGEGKCGEGKCGANKAGSPAAENEGLGEGKAMAEGKCGEDKAKGMAEGKCGEDKAKGMVEGKCGEDKAKGMAEDKLKEMTSPVQNEGL